jgi:uncharacterized membrane protein
MNANAQLDGFPALVFLGFAVWTIIALLRGKTFTEKLIGIFALVGVLYNIRFVGW